MKRYFYILDGKRIGPLSFEEIKATDISEETLVWYEGLENWQPAGELEEFLYLSFPPEETKPIVEDSLDSIEIIEPLIQDELVSTQEAISENAVIAVDNAPAVYQNSVESKLKAYTSSMNQYHGIDDPFASAQHQLIYPKQAMFSNPFGFKGRIRRTEYWLSYIIAYIYFLLLAAVTARIERVSGGGGAFFLFVFPFYWFLIAQNTKRCHDRGNSGWFQIIPFYGLWMAFGESDRFVNDYGPNPKGDNFQTRF